MATDGLNELAAQIAVLYNNVDMYEVDSKGNPALAGRYALASDLLRAKIEGLTSALVTLGYQVQVEGGSMQHTVRVSRVCTYTSRKPFSLKYRRAV